MPTIGSKKQSVRSKASRGLKRKSVPSSMDVALSENRIEEDDVSAKRKRASAKTIVHSDPSHQTSVVPQPIGLHLPQVQNPLTVPHPGDHPDLSIVVPAYNEEPNVDELCSRLLSVLRKTKRTFEIVIINDGSRDRTLEKLLQWHKKYPHIFRILDFNSNFGHHNALWAGFEHVLGDVVITMDADLQNPPEEIPKLLEKIDEGYDYVGSYRLGERQDAKWRDWASKIDNKLRDCITDIHMSDQGCMLRAYQRSVVNAIIQCGDYTAFIPALAYKFASKYTEIGMQHAPRFRGKTKYGLYYLLRTHFDLMTGFSLVPLQVFTLFGFALAGCSFLLVLYLLVRRLFLGPEAEGVFTLFAVLFFLVSVAIVGIGLIGEYLGRTYQILQRRPRYILKSFYDTQRAKAKKKKETPS